MIDVSLVPIIPQMQNYAYILESDNGEIGVVDPGEAAPIIDALEKRNLEPTVILITHHHWDHVAGIADMLAWRSCPVIGADSQKSSSGANPAKPCDNTVFEKSLSEGDVFSFGGETVEILDTPGHTPEHICFYFPDSGFALVGDTLFAMGCGRILDGSAEQLFNSLQKLNALPEETLLYCGHEYTLSNAEFAITVEPDNSALQERFEFVKVQRRNRLPSIPTTLKAERDTNVFLRAGSVEEFAELRHLKDRA